ncbi:MAG: hypothetical protein L0G69_10225 [Brevibacterium sp.]|uniref:hypothetical protein n=1 Tax=Brevibacterium sandarakinum TaxID=629680 RepID=UPI0026525E20|nr:hypothetical protein [Brevibacterium sandarakinum]MDN5586921.1 hypothetical protein [Brevibacterium sp.]MDN5657050.1 hypothetical protein [Brevibacterium sandarakinum]
MKKERSPRQRSRREALIVLAVALTIHAGFKLLGWGSQDLSWSQVILVAPVSAAVYWALSSSFRKFVEEDVTAKPPKSGLNRKEPPPGGWRFFGSE